MLITTQTNETVTIAKENVMSIYTDGTAIRASKNDDAGSFDLLGEYSTLQEALEVLSALSEAFKSNISEFKMP